MKFQIEQSDGGQRLDEFFASRFGGLSRMRIANLIEGGACLVNGELGRPGYRILAGDSVEVSFVDGGPTAMSPEPIPLEIVYEDEHLVVVVKPAGMLVHPTMNVKTGTLANALAYHFNRSRIQDGGWEIENPASRAHEPIDPTSSRVNLQPVIRPGIVHRLDRATSGLMVIARTQRALTVLSRHFRKRLVEKRYLAWVLGIVEEQTGSISAPIGRDPDKRPQWGVTENGKPAETRFKVIERASRATLLELEPITGRTNQLRIHCDHIGHPIVGDEMYGNFELRISNCELNTRTQPEQFEIRNSQSEIRNSKSEIRNSKSEIRLCLHACKLAFHHPASGEWLEFTSQLPDEFRIANFELRI